MAAAVAPANKRGMTCPVPKNASKTIPVRGFPCFAIQASSTARTGVVHGEDANPNIIPAAMGASGAGILSLQVFSSGPEGKSNFYNPNKLRPMRIVIIGTRIPISKGSCP